PGPGRHHRPQRLARQHPDVHGHRPRRRRAGPDADVLARRRRPGHRVDQRPDRRVHLGRAGGLHAGHLRDHRARDGRRPRPPVGNVYLLIRTDSGNAVLEGNEGNNVRAVPITVAAPDLAVSTVSGPSAAVLGDTVAVNWTVTNVGTVTAGGRWVDAVYLSADD